MAARQAAWLKANLKRAVNDRNSQQVAQICSVSISDSADGWDLGMSLLPRGLSRQQRLLSAIIQLLSDLPMSNCPLKSTNVTMLPTQQLPFALILFSHSTRSKNTL
jgi:hypothetical protein